MKAKTVNVKLLLPCKLFPGSNEELEYQYGGLTEKSVLHKIISLGMATDRTPAEDEYLKALKETVGLGDVK